MNPDQDPLDEDALRRSLDLFWHYPEVCADGGLIEIRLWQRPDLKGVDRCDKKKTNEIAYRGFFDNPDQAVKEIKRFDAQDKTVGVFCILNEIKSGAFKPDNQIKRGRSTRDQDIFRRRWLPIDIDPHRAAGIMASTEEKASAEEAANFIKNYLKNQGFPDPAYVDSGNGFHLLYRIVLPLCAHILPSTFSSDLSSLRSSNRLNMASLSGG